MTIMHHPSAATLTAFASGTLDEARAVVVASHLSLCPHCRTERAALETAGGVLLDTAASTAMNKGAKERTVERTLQRALVETDRMRQTAARPIPEPGLPPTLAPYALGKWWWIGGGLQFRSVDVPSDNAVRVFMLRAAPGARLPRHSHTGTEWTCVFHGAFRDDRGRFGPGDFDENDENHEHSLVAEEGVACVCLIALQGSIKLQSWLGRLVQSLIRI